MDAAWPAGYFLLLLSLVCIFSIYSVCLVFHQSWNTVLKLLQEDLYCHVKAHFPFCHHLHKVTGHTHNVASGLLASWLPAETSPFKWMPMSECQFTCREIHFCIGGRLLRVKECPCAVPFTTSDIPWERCTQISTFWWNVVTEKTWVPLWWAKVCATCWIAKDACFF